MSVCPPSRMEVSQSLRVSGKGALWGPWAWEEPLEQKTGGPSTGLEAPSASGPCSPTVCQTRSQSLLIWLDKGAPTRPLRVLRA